MKNQLFIILTLVNLFFTISTNIAANRDSLLTEEKDGFSFDPESESMIYAVYKTFSAELGGDKIRFDIDGNPCQGWIKDYYDSGQLLHRGYYVDGKLKIFKNYYANGNVERVFKLKGYRKSNMQLFYADGRPKSIIKFYKGNPRKCSEFYYYNNAQEEIYVKNK
jgi:antitoxin component YwqK of YwqJK toxin-antitoxin module